MRAWHRTYLPEKNEYALTESDTVHFGVEIDIGFNCVHQTNRYLVGLVEDEQVRVAIFDCTLDCAYDRLLLHIHYLAFLFSHQCPICQSVA